MRKKVWCLLLSVAMAATIWSGCSSPTTVADESQSETQSTVSEETVSTEAPSGESEVLVWFWVDGWLETMTEAFNEEYEGQYHAIYEVVPQNEIVTKFLTTSASGGRLPDAFFSSDDLRGKVLNLGVLEDLEQEPYNLDTSEIVDWVVDTCRDLDGVVRGLEIGPAPTTLAYNRNVAKQYLGTDDAEKVSEMLSDWDKVYEVGKKIHEESNGSVYISAGVPELSVVMMAQVETPRIVDNKINLHEAYYNIFDRVAKWIDEGLIDATIEHYSPAYQAALGTDNYLLWSHAMWASEWKFMTYAPDAQGVFGVLEAPPEGKWCDLGGTLMTVPSGAENKLGGYEYIWWTRDTVEGSTICRDNFGDIASIKACYEDESFHTSPQKYIDYFGEDVVALFADNIDKVVPQTLSPYDDVIAVAGDNINCDGVAVAFSTLANGGSADEAITAMEDELIRVYPELQREDS